MREAGGKVTTDKNEDNFLGEASILVTNRKVHNQLLSALGHAE